MSFYGGQVADVELRRAPGPFAELLVRHRLAAGLGQRDLARRAGLSERAVRDMERGATARPRRHSVLAVATALELSEHQRLVFTAAARQDGSGADTAPSGAFASPEPDGFIGRSRELRAVADLVLGGRHRLLTVTGVGGVGKSRLLAELVGVMRRDDTMELRTLSLTHLNTADLVGEVIAEALECGGASRLSVVERIVAHLRDRRTLLVLDRFERLITAAPVVWELVRRCPGLTVLTASQRPLHVPGERVVRLEALSLEDATALFVRRAAVARPGFARTAGNSAAITDICRQTGGLPLAVELAAARMRVLTPTELAQRMGRQLRVLTGEGGDVPERHRSVRAAIESSLGVVTEPARVLFAWLGAFAGGGRLADLEAVGTRLGVDPDWLLGALTELTDTGLVRVRAGSDGSRCTLPDPMAELAGEWLTARADRDGVVHAVAEHFMARLLSWSADPTGAASVTGDDADNVRAAIDWTIVNRPALVDPATVTAMYRYSELTGRYREGESMLCAAGLAGQPTAWIRAGQLAWQRGDFVEGARRGRRAIVGLPPDDHFNRARAGLLDAPVDADPDADPVARLLHAAVLGGAAEITTRETGAALHNLAVLAARAGRLDEAQRLFSSALTAKESVGADAYSVASTVIELAEVALEVGDLRTAARHGLAAFELFDACGRRRMAGAALVSRALALARLGALRAATAAVQAADTLTDDPRDDRRTMALLDIRSSVVLHLAGDRAAAGRRLARAVPTATGHDMHVRLDLADALETHAGLLAGDHPAAAVRLLGAADELRGPIDRVRPAATAEAVMTTIEYCRAALGAVTFDRERAIGAVLPPTLSFAEPTDLATAYVLGRATPVG